MGKGSSVLAEHAADVAAAASARQTAAKLGLGSDVHVEPAGALERPPAFDDGAVKVSDACERYATMWESRTTQLHGLMRVCLSSLERRSSSIILQPMQSFLVIQHRLTQTNVEWLVRNTSDSDFALRWPRPLSPVTAECFSFMCDTLNYRKWQRQPHLAPCCQFHPWP